MNWWEVDQQQPYERSCLKTVARVLQRRTDQPTHQPFETFEDLARYCLETFNLCLVLRKLNLSDDNFMLAFRKIDSRFLKRICLQHHTSIPPDQEVELGVVFPYRSTLFIITTWLLPDGDTYPRMRLPYKMGLYFWEDFVETLLLERMA